MIRRYLQVNDVHISDQPPRMRTATYRGDILDKLEACMVLAREYSADAVVITGDLFHRTNPTHTSHMTVQEVRQALAAPIPVWIVPGNHDYQRGRDGWLMGQPLLSVIGGNIGTLVGDDDADPWIFGLRWDNNMEGPHGIDWIAAQLAPAPRPLVFAHAPVTLEPYPFGPEQAGWIMAEELAAALPPEVRLFAHGHMHKGHQQTVTTQVLTGAVFSNPGALSRATIATDDTDREPMVALITYDTGDGPGQQGHGQLTVDYLPVPHRPAAEVFRTAVADAISERGEGIAALAQALASADLHVVTGGLLVDMLRGLPCPEDIAPDVWAQGITMGIEAVEDSDA